MKNMKKKHRSKTALSERRDSFEQIPPLDYFPPLHDYLNLRHRTWKLELDVRDFDPIQVSDILALPLKIYQGSIKTFFWQFLECMLSNCTFSFVKRSEGKEMALVGSVNKKKYAIPLWKLTDSDLIGFEIVEEPQFLEENPTNLIWVNHSPDTSSTNHFSEPEVVIMSEGIFFGDKIFLSIHNTQITLDTDLMSELDLFTRIIKTEMPELDEIDPEEK
jgi:hypothetical protein